MNQYVALFDLLGQANHLKQLPRTGWLFAGIAHAESIAEHSYVTTLLVFCLGEVINQCWADESLAKPLDVGRAVQIALVHDLAEAQVTDLPKRSTELIGKEIKHQAEEAAMKQIMRGLANEEEVLQLWQEYVEAASPESHLVKDADQLEMIYQAYCYQQQGYAKLSEFFNSRCWRYLASEKLFKQICQVSEPATQKNAAGT